MLLRCASGGVKRGGRHREEGRGEKVAKAARRELFARVERRWQGGGRREKFLGKRDEKGADFC